MILHLLDIASLWLIWWAAFAGVMGGHEVRTWRALALQLALLGVMASAFTGAIATYVEPQMMPLWARGLIYAFAAVAAWLYDYRFGVARHLRMAASAALQVRTRLRDAWQHRPRRPA